MPILTENQTKWLHKIKEIAQSEIAPRAADVDESGEFPWDIAKVLFRNDLLSFTLPAQYGGAGGDMRTFCLILEEIAKASATAALLMIVQALGIEILLIGGTEEQKRRYLTKLKDDNSFLVFALTEAGSGSDAASLKTKAVLKEDYYLLNGSKVFITAGGVADYFTVFAVTDSAKGIFGISIFIVERNTAGFKVNDSKEKFTGMRGSAVTELSLRDVKVPRSNLIGQEGQGFMIAMRGLDKSRLAVAAQAVGIGQAVLEFAVRYAKKRHQFGEPISKLQSIQFMLADMATRVHASRTLVHDAAELMDSNHKKVSRYSAMAKMFASDSAMSVTTDAVQILGGYGCLRKNPVERMMRDAKITQIYDGTNQIQRLIIAKSLI